MQMLAENWQPLRNETVIGPLSEGQVFVSYCEARGGRPKPNVKWFLNGKPSAGKLFPGFYVILYIYLYRPFFLARLSLAKVSRSNEQNINMHRERERVVHMDVV